MTELVKMINRENITIFPANELQTRDSILDFMSLKLHKNGFVKSSFVEAIKEREQKFPTGLNTKTYGIAIPHTDSEHVDVATIAVGILPEPVKFNEMGSENMDVNVQIIFMLAIKDPAKQLEALQAVIELLENEAKMKNLVHSENELEVIEILN